MDPIKITKLFLPYATALSNARSSLRKDRDSDFILMYCITIDKFRNFNDIEKCRWEKRPDVCLKARTVVLQLTMSYYVRVASSLLSSFLHTHTRTHTHPHPHKHTSTLFMNYQHILCDNSNRNNKNNYRGHLHLAGIHFS